MAPREDSAGGAVRATRWRRPAVRRAAQRRAADSADRLIARLQREIDIKDGRIKQLIGSPSPYADEISSRLSAAAPAITALVEGRRVDQEQRLRRNVGLHADMGTGFLPDLASTAELRRAQRGGTRSTVPAEQPVCELTLSEPESEELIPVEDTLCLDTLLPKGGDECSQFLVLPESLAGASGWHSWKPPVMCDSETQTSTPPALRATAEPFYPPQAFITPEPSEADDEAPLQVFGDEVAPCTTRTDSLTNKELLPATQLMGTFIPLASSLVIKGFPAAWMSEAIATWLAKHMGNHWEERWRIVRLHIPDLEEKATICFSCPEDCQKFFTAWCERMPRITSTKRGEETQYSLCLCMLPPASATTSVTDPFRCTPIINHADEEHEVPDTFSMTLGALMDRKAPDGYPALEAEDTLNWSVAISGLVKRTVYNGTLGLIHGYHCDKDRYKVLLISTDHPGRTLWVSPDCLTRVADIPEHAYAKFITEDVAEWHFGDGENTEDGRNGVNDLD